MVRTGRVDARATADTSSHVDDTVLVRPDRSAATSPEGRPSLPARYEDLGLLAEGSFGEVRRVRDTLLQRVVAMKILRAAHGESVHLRRRFLVEAEITAGLQHPGIVALYDRGQLADGRFWFTMREVRGRTLREIIEEVHAALGPEGFRETASGWTFRRLIDAFARVCQAVAYAHRRGVVHRDLKPDNLMTGELGEALVMDWGLARRVDASDAQGGSSDSDAASGGEDSPHLTRHGDVLGTPGYMPPEQARGELHLHGFASDVYALGAVLYHALAGRPPYLGSSSVEVLAQVLAGPPEPVALASGGKPIPGELVTICEKAMAREIGARHADAEVLAGELVAWLDGARRREQALARVAAARAREPEIAALRAEAASLRAEAQARLDGVRPFDPVERKEPGWAREDRARRLEVAAVLREAEWVQTMQGALTVDPDLPEAHAALAMHHKEELLAAERAHDDAGVVRAEAALRAHDRGLYTALLRGEGALTLVTDPPGASVRLYRYEEEKRRLVPRLVGEIGPTPVRERRLPKGSYLCVIGAEGRAEVRYPVLIERGGHWDGVPPGEVESAPIVLPLSGDLGAEDVYVPAGFCWTGSDAATPDGLPRRQVWIDAFVIQRFPVTTARYIDFLNDLLASGREAAAVAACPKAQLSLAEGGEDLAFQRDASGVFGLPPDREGLRWRLDWPVVLVDWHAGVAYARWLAARTGEPWRLPDELEREKVARGVDGRLFPWGDHPEPTFACVADTTSEAPSREAVGGHPVDESPYGARGLAGNTRDWCESRWKHEGPLIVGGRLRIEPGVEDDLDFRVIKGGAWSSAVLNGHAAARFGARPGIRRPVVGIRIARSYPVLAGSWPGV